MVACLMERPKQNRSTEEGRRFWQHALRSAARVMTFPAWMLVRDPEPARLPVLETVDWMARATAAEIRTVQMQAALDSAHAELARQRTRSEDLQAEVDRSLRILCTYLRDIGCDRRKVQTQLDFIRQHLAKYGS